MSTNVYEMSPFDNVLYFPNNIDIRLCPKNGMSTIKEIFRYWRGHDEFVGRQYRYDAVKREGDQFDLPFRKGSFRIAVRRCPVERFKSACEYMMRERAEHIRQGRFDIPELDAQIDRVLDRIELGEIKNNHFYTQSWYMGKPEDYNMVVNIDELTTMLRFVNEACQLGLTQRHTDVRINESKVKLYNDALSPLQVQRIKNLYKKDFDNGWCKRDDI